MATFQQLEQAHSEYVFARAFLSSLIDNFKDPNIASTAAEGLVQKLRDVKELLDEDNYWGPESARIFYVADGIQRAYKEHGLMLVNQSQTLKILLDKIVAKLIEVLEL